MSEKANFRALLPMIVFLVLFIGTGIALTAAGADMPFYQLSATVAIIPAIVLAILQGKDDLNKKIGVFLSGVGEINIITMCMIFLLAGGFASVASAIGGVKATVNFGLSLLPPSMILPGLFQSLFLPCERAGGAILFVLQGTDHTGQVLPAHDPSRAPHQPVRRLPQHRVGEITAYLLVKIQNITVVVHFCQQRQRFGAPSLFQGLPGALQPVQIVLGDLMREAGAVVPGETSEAVLSKAEGL